MSRAAEGVQHRRAQEVESDGQGGSTLLCLTFLLSLPAPAASCVCRKQESQIRFNELCHVGFTSLFGVPHSFSVCVSFRKGVGQRFEEDEGDLLDNARFSLLAACLCVRLSSYGYCHGSKGRKKFTGHKFQK